MSPTHTITLTVTVEGPEQWENVYRDLVLDSVALGKKCAVTLTSYLLEDHFDEQTLFKVSCGLREAGLSEEQVTTAIDSMLNNGILFRERD